MSGWTFVLAIVAGLSFSLLGVCYRIGMPRGARVQHIIPFLCVFGAVAWALRLPGQPPAAEVPAVVWVLGAACGASQMLVVFCLARTLALGPLSPAWCAMMLGFVLVVVFAAAGLDEPLAWNDLAAVVAAAACVLVGSSRGGRGPGPADGGRPARRARLLYALLLATLLVFNAAPALALKYLGATGGRESYFDRFGAWYFLVFYVTLGGGVALSFLVRRKFDGPWRWALLLSLPAATGSIIGMAAMGACAGDRAVAFAVANVTSILATAVVSVLAFGERADAVWVGTVATAGVTIGLANLPAIAGALGG